MVNDNAGRHSTITRVIKRLQLLEQFEVRMDVDKVTGSGLSQILFSIVNDVIC